MGTEIMGLGKRFGQVEALRDICLNIGAGEFVAILGPSGCGKTTLLRLLAGFDTPTCGEIWIGGKRMSSPQMLVPPEKRSIGMVFQSFALWPHMNVSEHVMFPLLHQKKLPAGIDGRKRERVSEVLKMVGLSYLAKRMPAELSGGQKQRVSLARAIVAQPPLLLMDEPLSSLDAKLRMEMRQEIQALHRRTGAAIVYVTHDQEEALAMADRIVVMNDGRIEQAATPEEIYSRPATSFVATFVGKANLLTGEWVGDEFLPAGTTCRWHQSGVSGSFHRSGQFPVRPEQLSLFRGGSGIKGSIVNVQYLGKEYRYLVDTPTGAVEVHMDSFTRFALGEQVSVQLVEAEQ